MKRLFSIMILVLSAVVVLTACGGGGGGGGGGAPGTGPSVTSLQGTWFGAYQITSTSYSLGIDVNGSGGITAVRRDGISLGLTGTLAKDHGNIFAFTLSDGTTGGFFADNDALHVAFLEDNGNFGVLQKGATSLPGYASANVIGSWSGYTVELDSSMNITNEGASSATVAATYSIAGSDFNGSFSGSISAWHSTYGYYIGTWSNAGGSGSLRAWLSVDKTFAAVWGCTGAVSYVVSIPNCTFSAWRKQ